MMVTKSKIPGVTALIQLPAAVGLVLKPFDED